VGKLQELSPTGNGNTKVITQSALQTFQSEMGKAIANPYKVVMKASKLPLSLLNDRSKNARVHLLDTESFSNTFGPKSHRKRPVIKAADVASLATIAEQNADEYSKDKDAALVDNVNIDDKPEARDPKFSKGQSKRIWNELYKVIDSSDVVIQVLDARDPNGTRSKHIEEFMKREKKHKHLIFILNKCDLVPTWVTRRWVAALSSEYPTLAFHASVTNPFGKGALIQLLRQFGKLHQDKKNISVGFIGYPNVGKSSIINTLKKKKVCKAAPIPGETKVWQYVTFMKRIYLIDCPGVVYPSGDTETEVVLKGVVRVENLKEPAEHIEEVLNRVKKEYISKTYKIQSWDDTEDFLEQFCRKSGRLLKGAEPDINTVAKMILTDFQRGRLPYYVSPPRDVTKKEDTEKETKNELEKDSINEITVKQNYNQLKVIPDFSNADTEKDVELNTDDENIISDTEQSDESDDATEEDCDEDLLNDTETTENTNYNAQLASNVDNFKKDSDADSDDELNVSEVLTNEERKFLGFNDSATNDGTKNNYKVVSSPMVMCVEAVDGSDASETKVDESRSNNSRKRKLAPDAEEGKKSKKEPRMTTNKKKTGSQYYEKANVKNRNKNKTNNPKKSPTTSTMKQRQKKKK